MSHPCYNEICQGLTDFQGFLQQLSIGLWNDPDYGGEDAIKMLKWLRNLRKNLARSKQEILFANDWCPKDIAVVDYINHMNMVDKLFLRNLVLLGNCIRRQRPNYGINGLE